MNISILSTDGTLTGTIAPGQSGPENNDNEELFHILQTPGLQPHHQMQLYVIPKERKENKKILSG